MTPSQKLAFKALSLIIGFCMALLERGKTNLREQNLCHDGENLRAEIKKAME